MGRMTVIFVLSWVLAAAGWAAEVAQVVALRGTATVLQGGRQAEVQVGQTVMEGAVFQTGSPGRVKLRFSDGSIVVIGDDSTFRVDHLRLDDKGGRSSSGFILDVGLISQTVAPGAKGSWAVRTPTAVTAVRGTEFLIEVKPDRSTEVLVRTGEVVVEPLERPKNLRIPDRNLNLPPPTPVILDHKRFGTSCDPETYICTPATSWQPERESALNARRSARAFRTC